MSKDLDRHCQRQQRELETRIAKLESILSNRRCRADWRAQFQADRNECVIELHDMRRAHDSYDRRRAEAHDDPTGQDAEGFDDGESSHGWTPCGGGYLSNGRGGYRENFGY